ncbi:hypothetical protein HBA49_12925 [Corynebacterium matruchotii]|uniref:hypothetical protein n=1 Tax=Corynebacterium matruchotii TaxID=43768 RepID=UPI001ABFE5A5|nr:hypothetical protein [Corynebacterium matruchotii]QSX72411.1 hypothetical protein HBA49_12925 [Corynebacterium matruchotii]
MHSSAGQPVEGPPQVGCQIGVAAGVGQQARRCGLLQRPVVALSYRAVASCCIGRVPASVIIRSIFRQDDAAVVIDQWIDQYALKEHLVEQLLQVGGCRRVEAVAVFEEVKGLGEALADFGYVGLVGGQLALDMVELGRELGLFLLEQLQGDGTFVVGVHQAAALVFDVRPPGGEGADCPIFVALKVP